MACRRLPEVVASSDCRRRLFGAKTQLTPQYGTSMLVPGRGGRVAALRLAGLQTNVVLRSETWVVLESSV